MSQPEHPFTKDEIRTVNGVDTVNRAAIARVSEKSKQTIDRAAGNSTKRDPDFPPAVNDKRIDHTWWYPVPAAAGYLRILAERDAGKLPPPVPAGADDELLGSAEAAEEIGVSTGTFSRYVNDSRPYWDPETDLGRHDGILPPPDVETPAHRGPSNGIHREWYRGTLREHQAKRPGKSGPGAGAGRPTHQGADHE